MNKIFNFGFILLATILLLSCNNEAANSGDNNNHSTDSTTTNSETPKEEVSTSPEKTYTSEAGRTVPFYQYEAFKKAYLEKDNDTTYVVNFWATWCGPCVKELPYFFETEKALADKPVKFIYASLDFKRKIEKKLLPFIDKKEMDAVVVLDQKDAEWMKDIDASWDGAIPATLVFNKKGTKFYRQSFETAEDVKKMVEENM